MYFEVQISKNIEIVKEYLKKISEFYEEDFILKDVVFIKISKLEDLDKISKDIILRKEQFAYLMEKGE